MSRPFACFALLAVLAAIPAAAHPSEPASPAVDASEKARKTDLAQFRTKFLARDRSFSPEARAEAEVRLTQLEGSLAGISQARFELELARIVALADNGHTASFPGPRSRRYNRVAIRLVPFGEDFYVLRARAPLADLLGGRLVAIDDRPVAELRAVSRTLIGGTPAWRDRNAGYFLESPEQMQALGVVAGRDSATYRLALPDGREVTRRLAGEPASDRPRANASRWLYPAALEGEGEDWRTLMAPDRAPWALQEPGTPFRWRESPELGALVIEMRQNNGSEGHPIDAFLRDMTKALRDRHPRHLVLDMRLNGGGDLTTTRDFMESLPELVPGRIFVLTSPWTFSAAISSVGYLEQAAPERVTIVGEGVGDRLRMWSEGDVVELPNSHAMILNATERHDYMTGCKGYRDCHGNVVRHPIAVPDLDPDLAAPWTLEMYRAGRDPAMERVAEALRAGG